MPDLAFFQDIFGSYLYNVPELRLILVLLSYHSYLAFIGSLLALIMQYISRYHWICLLNAILLISLYFIDVTLWTAIMLTSPIFNIALSKVDSHLLHLSQIYNLNYWSYYKKIFWPLIKKPFLNAIVLNILFFTFKCIMMNYTNNKVFSYANIFIFCAFLPMLNITKQEHHFYPISMRYYFYLPLIFVFGYFGYELWRYNILWHKLQMMLQDFLFNALIIPVYGFFAFSFMRKIQYKYIIMLTLIALLIIHIYDHSVQNNWIIHAVFLSYLSPFFDQRNYYLQVDKRQYLARNLNYMPAIRSFIYPNQFFWYLAGLFMIFFIK